MARRAQWPPKIRNHKGRARVRIKGRDYYLGSYGTAEAQRNYTTLLDRMQTDPHVKPKYTNAAITVAGLVQEYLAMRHRERGPDDRETANVRTACRPLIAEHGDDPAEDFKARHLHALQRVMAGTPWNWCLSNINRQINRIRKVFRWGELQEHVPAATYANLKAVQHLDETAGFARRSEPTKPTSFDDLMRVISYCPDPVAVAMEVQWYSGMRTGEVRVMRTCDIDRSGDVWLYRPHQHKNKWRGQARVVPLCDRCQRLLLPWIDDSDPARYLFKPPGPNSGDCYTKDAFCRAVARASKKAGVKITSYGNRHAAKMRIAREHGIEAAKAVLGQRSIKVTEGYGDIDLQLAVEIMKRKRAG